MHLQGEVDADAGEGLGVCLITRQDDVPPRPRRSIGSHHPAAARCGINDGAAALVLMSAAEAAKRRDEKT